MRIYFNVVPFQVMNFYNNKVEAEYNKAPQTCYIIRNSRHDNAIDDASATAVEFINVLHDFMRLRHHTSNTKRIVLAFVDVTEIFRQSNLQTALMRNYVN